MPTPTGLSKLRRFTRWPIMQKVRRHPPHSCFKGETSTACKPRISVSLSLPAWGTVSPFPHGTGSLSVKAGYLGLEGGAPIIKQDVPVLFVPLNLTFGGKFKRYVSTGLSPSLAEDSTSHFDSNLCL